MSLKPKSVWEGVFPSYKDAGGDLDAFDKEIWIEIQRKKVQNSLEGLSQNAYVSKDYPLPYVVGMLLSIKPAISVLDFGGGMGAQYLELIAKVPEASNKVNYHVIETKTTLQNLPLELSKFKRLQFSSDLEAFDASFDIIHIGSTLQYIEDWQGILKRLTIQFNPSYFVFSDLQAGEVPTFVSHQIFYGKKIPHLFLNIKAFENYLKDDLEFELMFKTKFSRPIMGQEEIFPNQSLPETHRIDRPLNLFFIKKINNPKLSLTKE